MAAITRGILSGLLVFCFIFGCGDYKQVKAEEEIIALKKHHATRVFVLCKKGDKFVEESYHESEKITCGSEKIEVGDYLKYEEYVPLRGKEKELQEYLAKPKK